VILNSVNLIQKTTTGDSGWKRFIALALSFLLLLTLLTGSIVAAPEATGLILDYHIKALKDDHPEIILSIKGVPNGTTLLELQTKSFKDIRKAFSDLQVTSPSGQSLTWSWTDRGITVENGSVRDFVVSYTLNALEWEGGTRRVKSIYFREGYLFFVAEGILLMPETDPEGITVRFTLPPGQKMYSNLPEMDGIFTAETSLWGSLRYDFPMAYFMGGVPLYDVERTTPWGDTYQIIRFERDPINWFPSWGTTPWEEADRYLDTYQQYWDYIQQNILPPLPNHKVLFADRSHNPGAGINDVGINTDWYHFMQYYGSDHDADIAHHIIHSWAFQWTNSKLVFNFYSLGEMFREGLPTYYEHTLPAIVREWDWAPGKLFEFWVLEQRGTLAGIQQNYYHQTYNQSGLRLYLLDQYIRRTTGKDLSALTYALWDEVKDLKAPRYITDGEIRHAFANVVGNQNVNVIDQIATQTEFSRSDFAALEPAFKLYVDHWAQEAFWDKPLLFLIYLEMAATFGDVWPHYATSPHEIQGMGSEAMRQFKEALSPLADDGLTKAEVLAGLSQVTGQQHNDFFEFWADLGYDLDPNSLLPFSTWAPEDSGESELIIQWNVGGTLQTEHYLSGLPQQAIAVLDEPAPTDTIEIEVALRSFEGFPSVAEAEKALSGPNVDFQWSFEQKYGDLYKTSGIFKVRTDDPERRKFSFTLNLPAFAYHPRFTVATGRDVNGEVIWDSRYPYPPDLYFLHSFDPVTFTATLEGASLHLGTVSLEDAYFQVADIKSKPGETVTLSAGTGQTIQVDLYDKYDFLRGRQTVTYMTSQVPAEDAVGDDITLSQGVIAIPTKSTVLVNGIKVAFEAYNIGGNNYFKLRDLAKAIIGTQKQFDIGWDGAANAISITTGKPYTTVGGELAVSSSPANKTATATSSKIYLNGKEVQFTAYNIGGNNYFKLRDVAAAINFSVTWDSKTSTIGIDTSTGYVAP